MTEEMILQVAVAAVGAFGFGLLFLVSGGRLLTITLGGAANWIFYLLAMEAYADRVLAFFLSALATAVLAEILARLLKTPVITLLVPMLVPLVPGGDLYYTTFSLVRGDMEAFGQYGSMVIREAGAMSFGIILVACGVQTAMKIWMLRKEHREKDAK